MTYFVVYLREFLSLIERFTEYSNTAFKDKECTYQISLWSFFSDSIVDTFIKFV